MQHSYNISGVLHSAVKLEINVVIEYMYIINKTVLVMGLQAGLLW